MFEEFNGLPLHALAVHGPVVLVPLLVLASVAYALVPRFRGYLAWAAVLLAVVAPLSVLVAKLSGDAFVALVFSPDPPEAVVEHRHFGTQLLLVTSALGVLTLGLVWARLGGASSPGRSWVARGLTVLLLVAAAVSAVWVFRTGDTGAQMIWHNRLPS